MGFISNWLLKTIEKARENQDNVKGCEVKADRGNYTDFGNPLNITVYNAHGGKIVSFRSYDRHHDRSDETTYIIHPDEEFATSLGKLIAMEEIKHVG